MKSLSILLTSTAFAQFGGSNRGAGNGITAQQQELLRRRRKTTPPPTEYPTDPPFFNEDELLANGGYDGIYTKKQRLRRTIPGSLRAMTDEDLELINRSAVPLQTDQEIEVHEGLA